MKKVYETPEITIILMVFEDTIAAISGMPDIDTGEWDGGDW